eukprot:TRINITY_DN31498_c0_g1_i1.p2 TRINITY_DN31498_c0_g1~~TRINITY_DN31498_c0_g1_i1.p2  ORF type:complete len:279 (-),score=47.45 TRINITY_DN31498_c0_g1_i1:1439-2275(-)
MTAPPAEVQQDRGQFTPPQGEKQEQEQDQEPSGGGSSIWKCFVRGGRRDSEADIEHSFSSAAPPALFPSFSSVIVPEPPKAPAQLPPSLPSRLPQILQKAGNGQGAWLDGFDEEKGLEKERQGSKAIVDILEDTGSATKDHTKERPARMCVVCFTNPINTAALPCRHSSICSDCMEQVRGICPICRSQVDYVLHGEFADDFLDVAPIVLAAASRRVVKVRELAYDNMYANVRTFLLIGAVSAIASCFCMISLPDTGLGPFFLLRGHRRRLHPMVLDHG